MRDMSSLALETLRRALAPSLEPSRSEPEGKAAAVAAIIRESPSDRALEVLFIRRATRQGDPWSGHMAFPGGRRDVSDRTLLATAIRETFEEIGVDLTHHAELVGVLDDQDASGRGAAGALPIRPFVFAAHSPIEAQLSDEVDELVWAPVAELVRDERRTSVEVEVAGETYSLPGWDLGGRIVWGLTYRMMRMLLRALDLHARRSGLP
jgi:8-oxo-dGTP pyrophosphatase MutT (NUDIX family)